MNIEAVFIFKSDSGTSLYSRKKNDLQEDLFAAFLSALKSFFNDFKLGGLSSFSSDNYIVYLASSNNVLTSILVDKKFVSEKYYSLAYQISKEFYNRYKNIIESQNPIIDSSHIKFDQYLDNLLQNYDVITESKKEIVRLYKINQDGEIESFDYINKDQLRTLSLFLYINSVTKHIYILENSEDVPNRQLFFANRSASNLNQRNFKSEYLIQNISEPWDCERLIGQIDGILRTYQ
ncbi:MAG: hypothetical protein ACFFD1_12870 [Candidatus Thorarchaeota archaeon]